MRRHVDRFREVDAEAASAEYRNGVLTVTLPREETAGKRIDVE